MKNRIVKEMIEEQNKQKTAYSTIKDGVLVKFDARDLNKNGTYVTPKGVVEIGSVAFENCNFLLGITLGEDVVKVGNCAFKRCEFLQYVNMADNVTKLGDYAFQGCFSLMVANLSNGIKEIPEGAFYDCGNLYRVFLPKNLEKIGKYAFCDCSEFRCITPPPATLTEVGYMAFSGAPIGNKFMSAFKANKAITKQNAKLK